MSDTPLASAFAKTDKADWQKLVERGLKGASIESALATALYEGFAVQPLYTHADAPATSLPGKLRTRTPREGAHWTVIQSVDHLDVAEAACQLQDDLQNGATGIRLQFGGNIPYGGAYLGARTVAEFAQLLEGVDLTAIEIYLCSGFDAIPGAALLLALAEDRGVELRSLQGSAGFDPLSIVAGTGYIPADRSRILSDAIDAAHYFRARQCGLTPFLASGRLWHQAGGSAVEELAFTLAASVSYWRALAASGLHGPEATRAVDVCLTAENDFFLTVAKFRAARALWARAIEAAGGTGLPRFLSEMSFREISERDAHVNILRGVASTFGAALGGAEGAIVIPFNTRAGAPDAFARRLARNTQLTLMEESQLGRVGDPAGGSWYVENLTGDLCARAWDLFRSIEREGGLLAAIESGTVGDALWQVRRRRERAVATGRDAITGVSAFPNLAEKPVAAHANSADIDLEHLNREGDIPTLPDAGEGGRFAAMVDAARAGATLRGLERALEPVYERRALVPSSMRFAEPFEKLRRASDLALFRIGARPPVFLAALGQPSDFTARLTWARSFFEAGGIEVLVAQGFSTTAELAAAFRDSPAPVACLCSSDRLYAEMPGMAAALKSGGAAAVYSVTPPAGLQNFSHDDQHSIDRILYAGCDMLSIHDELQAVLRVEEMSRAADDDDDM